MALRSGPASPSAATFYGWWIVGSAFVFMMMIVGFALYGLPLFYNWWIEAFGWNRTQVQMGNTTSKIVIGPAFGFLAGWAIERFGPRRVIVSGAIFAGVAMAGFSVMTSLTQLYVFYFFNALGYLCAGPLPCQVLLSNWFRRLRGRVMGIAYVGIGVGGMVVPWLILAFKNAFGWPWALRLLGLIILITLGSVALLVVRRQPSELGLLPDGDRAADAPPAQAVEPLSITVVARSRAFWLLALGSVMSIGAVGGVMQNLALYIADILPRGQVDLMKTTIASLALMSSIAGRLVMGYLADRVAKKRVMLATYLIVGLSIPALILAREQTALLYVFAMSFGFGLGADYMLIPLMTAECFGLAALSRILGLIITTDSVGEALMPSLVAYVRDSTGSYAPGFLLLTGMALVGALAIALIPYREGVAVSRLEIADRLTTDTTDY
jgi:sugar phosphate permease